jgi:hypothetical protein
MASDDGRKPVPPPAMVSWPLPDRSIAPESQPIVPAAETRIAPPRIERGAPPPSQHPSSPPRRSRWPLILAVVVAVAVVVGAAAWLLRPDAPASQAGSKPATVVAPLDNPAAPAAPTPSVRSSPRPSKSTSTAASREKHALADLSGLRSDSIDAVTLDGSWVAQLSTKSVGTVDKSLVAANGTHRFAAADILAEHLQLRKDDRFNGTQILLLKGTDFGQRSTDHGKPWWITVASGSFFDEQSVKDFCQSAYPEKHGQALTNLCTARRLTAPH